MHACVCIFETRTNSASGWPETYFVAWDGFELIAMLRFQFLSTWITVMCHHAQLIIILKSQLEDSDSLSLSSSIYLVSTY